jgi:hypothetical protein
VPARPTLCSGRALVRCFPPLACAVVVSVVGACAGFPDTAPQTNVVLDNRYPLSTALVVYDAYWLNVSFAGQRVFPGASSAPLSTIPASADNTAYVTLAPGWDPRSAARPTSFILLQSLHGYALALGDTLHIEVDDVDFAGNCAAGSHLTPEQASFLIEIVFPADFAGFAYDPSTCTTTQIGDAGED